MMDCLFKLWVHIHGCTIISKKILRFWLQTFEYVFRRHTATIKYSECHGWDCYILYTIFCLMEYYECHKKEEKIAGRVVDKSIECCQKSSLFPFLHAIFTRRNVQEQLSDTLDVCRRVVFFLVASKENMGPYRYPNSVQKNLRNDIGSMCVYTVVQWKEDIQRRQWRILEVLLCFPQGKLMLWSIYYSNC